MPLKGKKERKHNTMKHFRNYLIVFAAFIAGAFGIGSMFDSELARINFLMIWFLAWSVVLLVDTVVYVVREVR